ncbi:hypothetical protein GDO81_014326 [Engystomops pustulosus]|uniref:Interleukin-1 n=1 Tax=Engystomops pustulosus TaxID=76066 RepID=A0AAV7B9K8_ENGPU|nr:hypothetical protein GDO81_014326 [Engystomops pustulosus]
MEGFFLSKNGPSVGTNGFILDGKTKVVIRNFQKDILTVQRGETTPTFKSDSHLIADQATFFLNTYKKVTGNGEDLPVAITCKIGNKNYLLCIENNLVILKESELPKVITSETSEFIFYKRNSFSEATVFEPSVMSGFYLACSEDGRDLILKPYYGDKSDKTAEITVAMLAFKGTKKRTSHYLQNSNKDFLIALPEESIATFESKNPETDEKAVFYLTTYRDTSPANSLPVVISCQVNKKNYLLCARKDSVILKQSELPEEIPTKTSEFIFYMINFSHGDNGFRFESSVNVESGKFCLAWNHEDPRKKLILKPYRKEETDETMRFLLIEKS